MSCDSPTWPAPDFELLMTKVLPLTAVLLLCACPAPTNECEPVSGEGTTHSTHVTANEVWRAADGPHQVTQVVRVQSGATLTIEACAVVRLAPAAGLEVGTTGCCPEAGTLVAEGTPTKPIRFERAGTEPWGAVVINASGSASLAHTSLTGGGEASSHRNATLVASGDGALPLKRVLKVEQVTVEGSKGLGVSLGGMAGFTADSTGLVVTGSGAGDTANPQPLRVDAQAWGTIPGGTYTGNATDEVRIDLALGGQIQESTIASDLGVPYRLVGIPGTSLRVAAPSPAGMATLTVRSGVVMKFDPGTQLEVGMGSRDSITNPGSLVAVGTAAAPILFTSAATTPAAGDWRGLAFTGSNGLNRLDFVRVDYAGGECACVVSGCFPSTAHDSAIFLYDLDGDGHPGFITNSRITQSASHGIACAYVSNTACPDLVSSGSNTFAEVPGCKQVFNEPETGVCTTACL